MALKNKFEKRYFINLKKIYQGLSKKYLNYRKQENKSYIYHVTCFADTMRQEAAGKQAFDMQRNNCKNINFDKNLIRV